MSQSDPNVLLAALSRFEALRNQSPCKAQRRFQRFAVRGEALLRTLKLAGFDEKPIYVMLRDIGPNGIGFLSDRPLEVNSHWRVSFLNRGCVIAEQAMVIRHSRGFDQQVHLVGGPFCADPGLLCVLGIDPRAVQVGDGPTITDGSAILAPEKVI